MAPSDLLAHGEAALHRGESEAAFIALAAAARDGVPAPELDRLAVAFAQAARFLGRHVEVLGWIESQVATGSGSRARLLRARIAVCRHVDVPRVLDLGEEALAAADAEGDEESYGAVLADVAFAAYREGATRRASELAERAADRAWTDPVAAFFAARARFFACAVRGDLEEGLRRCEECESRAEALGRLGDVANEANNRAEIQLSLGKPELARAAAARGLRLSRESGHRRLEAFSAILGCFASAEAGDLDGALAALGNLPAACSPIQATDAAAAQSFWLLERGAAGDAELAARVAEEALGLAERVGVANRLTALYGQIARSRARRGDDAAARVWLERARRAADRAEPTIELMLALALAEVLPAGDAARGAALSSARARILRGAGRRADPQAYCAGVRLHRRLLELSGGVPTDLPGAS